MDIEEIEKYASENGLKRVSNYKGKYKSEGTFFLDANRLDIYGIYKTSEQKYIPFYECCEREKIKEYGEFDTEQEAFNKLYKVLKDATKVKK